MSDTSVDTSIRTCEVLLANADSKVSSYNIILKSVVTNFEHYFAQLDENLYVEVLTKYNPNYDMCLRSICHTTYLYILKLQFCCRWYTLEFMVERITTNSQWLCGTCSSLQTETG